MRNPIKMTWNWFMCDDELREVHFMLDELKRRYPNIYKDMPPQAPPSVTKLEVAVKIGILLIASMAAYVICKSFWQG